MIMMITNEIFIKIVVITVVPLPLGKPHCFRGPHCLQRRRRSCTETHQHTAQHCREADHGPTRPGEPTWATMYSEAANTHRCPIYDTGPPLFSFGLNVHVKWTLNVDDRKFNFSSKGKSSNGSFVLHQARLNPWKTKHMHPCTNDPAPWY